MLTSPFWTRLASMRTSPDGRLNLIALSNRLTSACSSRILDPTTQTSSTLTQSSRTPATRAADSTVRSALSRTLRTRSASGSAVSGFPDSSSDNTSKSEAMLLSLAAWALIISRNFRLFAGSSSAPSSSVSAYPRMAVSGVRSSCETLATKSLRMFSSWLMRVMS